MSSKLVRTQLMLDKDVLDEIRPLLSEQKISLAQYVRDIMADKPKIKKASKQQKFKNLINKLNLQDINFKDLDESLNAGKEMRKNFKIFKNG